MHINQACYTLNNNLHICTFSHLHISQAFAHFPTMHTTVIDTLATPQAEQQAALAGESGQSSVRYNHWHRAAETDTTPPDPRLMGPLAPGQPLTMKPEMFTTDYWAESLRYKPQNEFAAELDSLSGMSDSTLMSIKPTGIAGDPVPYQFRTDSIVTIILMLSFFLMVKVVSGSRHYLHQQIKDFFRQRENLFVQRTQTEMRGQAFLVFQTCIMLGVLFFDYTQEHQADVFNQISPYKILGVSVAICSLYFMLKTGVYTFINNIFFTRKQCEQWANSYMLCTLGLGIALLPLSLLVVYFDLAPQNMCISFICLLIISKLLLLYKCSRIFFNYTFGWVHLFLYFCTLEIVPISVLFRALAYANNYLLTIN